MSGGVQGVQPVAVGADSRGMRLPGIISLCFLLFHLERFLFLKREAGALKTSAF